jgi:hypothetical protein
MIDCEKCKQAIDHIKIRRPLRMSCKCNNKLCCIIYRPKKEDFAMKRKLWLKVLSVWVAVTMLVATSSTISAYAAEISVDESIFDIDFDADREPTILDDIEVPEVDMSVSRTDVVFEINSNRIDNLEAESYRSGIIAGTASNYLLATDDYHLYSITLSNGMYLQAQLTTPNNATLDYDLYLLDSDGEIVVGSDYLTHINGSAGTLPEAMGYIAEGNSATYYIAVLSSSGGSASEAYTLDYSISTSYDTLEIDESARQAIPFTIGGNGSTINYRNLSSPIDNDWYIITIPSSRNYNKVTISLTTTSSNTCTYEVYQNVSSNYYEMNLVGTGSPLTVSTGTYYLRVSNALSMVDFDDNDIENYTLTITPVIAANRITMTDLSGTEGHKYVTYSGYGNHFRTATGTVTVTGYAYYDDPATNTSVIAPNTPITIMYYNPYWESNNTPDWAYVYAYGVTDSTGKYTINISLPASAASINVDTGVSYHYFDFCAIYALLSDNTSVNVYEPIFHFAYSIYHSF